MFNPESDIIARIEAIEIEARHLRRQIEHTRSMDDRRVLDRQIGELTLELTRLRERLTPRAPRLVPSK